MTVCKPYDESTAADFRRLFVERFPGGDASILDTFLSNPARKSHPSSGAVAYDEDGAVKAILGMIPRVVYEGQQRLLTLNGVAIAVRKDANRDFFSGFISDSIRTYGADMYFVNTAIPPSRKRTALAVGTVDGPASCAEIRERSVRSNGLVARIVRKAWAAVEDKVKVKGAIERSEIAERSAGLREQRNPRPDSVSYEREIGDADFNGFWSAYLKGNRGLVSSRTADELRWVFGKGLASGDVVLLTARRAGALQGYVFCRRTDETGACWRIVDMIAIGNDEKVLSALVEGAAAFLRRHTPATCLQVTGFPTWVQPLLRRLFPKSSSFGFNKCIWTCLNDKAKSLCGDWVNAESGWYGCPYDGDMCIV